MLPWCLWNMFMPPCSTGAPWKSPLNPSCTFLWLIPAAAPGEPRALLLPWARTPRGCSLQNHDSLLITPGTHSRHGSDPSPEEGPQQPRPHQTAQPGEAKLCLVSMEQGPPTGTPDPLCSAATSVSTTSWCSTAPSLSHPPLPAHSSAPVCSCAPSHLPRDVPPSPGPGAPRLAGPSGEQGSGRGRAYPGGRASGAGTAARAGGVLEPEASSASPALGRAAAPEPSAALAGAGALAPAAGLSSSLSAAPTASPFTAKAEGRNVSTPKGVMNRTHAVLAAEHTGGGNHCHRAQDQRCCQQWQQLLHPAARSLWNHCHCLCPRTKVEGTLHLCSVSPLPPANVLQA